MLDYYISIKINVCNYLFENGLLIMCIIIIILLFLLNFRVFFFFRKYKLIFVFKELFKLFCGISCLFLLYYMYIV